jgi:TatA/E family protein of Tat protein translocase
MLDIGFQEILVLMVVALLVFGPSKLPELGRRLGRALREFRRASEEFRSTIETNLQITEESILPPSASTSPTAVDPAGSGSDASGLVASGDAAGSPAGGEGSPASDGASEGGFPAEPVAMGEPYWTRRGGRLLHRSGCSWRARVPEGEVIGLKTFGEGSDLGLQACPACEPRDVEVPS